MPWTSALRTGTAHGNNDHLAEYCRDDLCRRLPCVLYKRGFEDGYRKGYEEGYGAGYGAGYSAGYSAGFSAGSTS